MRGRPVETAIANDRSNFNSAIPTRGRHGPGGVIPAVSRGEYKG